MLEVLNANPSLTNLAANATFVERSGERVTTRFEKRGARLGHGVWDLAFQRT
jgi:tRNA (guanine-N7-)-methyltransferase